MKTLNSALVALAAVGAIAAGPVSTNASPVIQTTSTAKPTDSAIDTRIEARLKADATLKKYGLSVSVDKGVVTLEGMVATEAQKLQAARLAKVTGVTSVENELVVDKAADMNLGAEIKDVAAKTATKTKETAKTVGEKTKDGAVVVADKTKETAKTVGEKTKDGAVVVADKTKDAAMTVGEKTKDGAVVVADKTKAAVSKTGEVITDAWITTKVSADFVDEDTLKGSNINVDTNNHVVTLKGSVKTTAGRNRAIQIAKTTDGVTRVVNQLVIGSK